VEVDTVTATQEPAADPSSEENADDRLDALAVTDQADLQEPEDEDSSNPDAEAGSARAVFHVNVSLDSSLDTEKLERQLRLLRKYGAI
jgi:hypothetical protein